MQGKVSDSIKCKWLMSEVRASFPPGLGATRHRLQRRGSGSLLLCPPGALHLQEEGGTCALRPSSCRRSWAPAELTPTWSQGLAS